jgi:hypothetical protein
VKRDERDYSHRSLFDKLGVTADARVAIVGAHDRDFVTALNLRLAKSASERLRRSTYDLIFVRIDRPRDLGRIARVVPLLKPDGALWVFHPKGKGALPSDADVRAAGLAAGLVDNKISAYSETHTATRYVIPVAARATKPTEPS